MSYTVNEVLEYVKENDVKFVRLAFCDLFGNQKNMSIMVDRLEEVFKNGAYFDASAISGFADVSKSDLLLFPDPSTLSVLPWRPQQGRVIKFICEIKNPDKTPYVCDSREILKKAVKNLEDIGYECHIGTECEFYLFKTDENGNPIRETIDKGGYLDIAPLDKGENIRRETCLTLEEMGIRPLSSHHEEGPGQNEIDFIYNDPLEAADNYLIFKSVVKAIATRNGLFASFMPKPLKDESGNGLHINISLNKNQENLFNDFDKDKDINVKHFIAGILDKSREITAFLNSTVNSYERLGSHKAPLYISWSKQNRSQLVRIPASIDDTARMELRSPDPVINPYLATALIIEAGLDGINNKTALPKPHDINIYKADKEVLKTINTLPVTLKEALDIAKGSDFIKKILPYEIIEKYVTIKEEEVKEYQGKSEDFVNRYFNQI